MKVVKFLVGALCCSFAGGLLGEEITYTPSSEGWGAALTVSDGQIVTIAAGTTAKAYWNGAITVGPGGTLRTTGLLTTIGTMTVQCATTDITTNGHLDIVSGVYTASFASKGINGDFTLRAGATVIPNCTDAFYYSGSAKTLEFYGTWQAGTTRQSITSDMTVKIHDGAVFTGAGDGNGALYFSDANRVLCDGTILFDVPFQACDAGENVVFACQDNTTLKFPRGFAKGSANILFEAATTDEGGTGSCANLKLEITDGGSSSSPITLRGDVTYTLASTAKHALTLADNATLTLVATEAAAKAGHLFALPLPTISGTGTCTLTGDGVVALPAAYTFPVTFGGATVLASAPCALADGSAATAATKILVNDLAAGETTTLFTGTDVASFDASLFTVQPAHLDVPVGAASSAALADGALVANNVAEYEASPAWIEPYLVRKALIWLDAADGSNFTFDGAKVTGWKDKTLYGRNATSYAISGYTQAWGTYEIVDGVPAYRMGNCGSGIDMLYTKMSTIRTVFWTMAIKQQLEAFFLGNSGSEYNFHRGTSGQYSYSIGGNNNNTYYCDGTKVNSITSDKPSTDRHVYSCVTAANLVSDRLTQDRGCSGRHAGRDYSELIVLDEVLSDTDRQAIEAVLAAKWMGDTPTAGCTAVSATLTSALAVTGSQSYTLPVELADGVSISITDPIAGTPAISSTGAITVSATTIPLTVDALHASAGTYTLIEGGEGTSLALENFSASLRPPAGGTATLAVQDGKLVLIVTADGGESSTLTWRPTSAEELVWSTDTVSWLDSDTRTAFRTGASVLFDSNETQSGAVTLNDTVTIGAMRVTGANDYSFEGTGTIDGTASVVLAGSGTTTLNGPNFGTQTIDIQSGTVVLGRDAGTNALGTATSAGGGTVNIASGAQFNLNYTLSGQTTTDARAAITQLKTFQIAGAGPDGRGAFVNDATDGRTTHNTAWNSAVRRIELTDDATIGGVDRFDVRLHTATTATQTGGIYGEGKTLTIKNSGYFGLVGLPISVGSVVIAEGGVFRPESIPTASINVPGGITLDGGILHAYSTTYPATMPLAVTENGGTVTSQTGDTVFNGPLNIPENATLVSDGSATTYYSGAITNEGTIKVTGGTTVLAGATADGNHVTMTGGTLWTRNTSVGTETITHSGGTIWIDTGTDADHLVVNSTATAPYLYRTPTIKTLDFNGPFLGIKTDTLVGPTIETANLTLGNSSFDVLPQADGWADVTGTFNVTKNGGTMYVYGPNNNDHGMKMVLKGTVSASLLVGLNGNRRGGLELKSGSDLAVTGLSVGDGGSGPSTGKLVIDSGAKLSVTGTGCSRNGHWSGTGPIANPHTIDVGGTLLVPSVITYLGYDAPRTEMYLRDGGYMALKGLQQRNGSSYGAGVGTSEGWHRFRMEGGEFDMGDSGFQDENCVPGTTLFDLANGTLKNTAAWGCTRGINIFIGETTLGGHLVYDLGNYLVNWNTGLAGSSALTIKGSANFQCAMRPADYMQGAMLGKVTVENTGANDLRNVSVFGGGLELAEGTKVTVGSWGDEKYAYTVSGTGNMAGVVDTAWSYPYVSPTFFTFMNTDFSSNPYTSNTAFTGRGEFYVPEAKAGKWTFAGSYDDYIYFQVDTTNQVIRSGGTKCGSYCGTVNLTAGWHTFTFLLGDATGACKPSPSGQSLGFLIGESTSTTMTDYTKFAPGASLGDDLTLQIRPYANACVWSYQNGNGSWDTTESWTHVKAIKSVDIMHWHSGRSDASTYSAYLASKANRFAGWFKVEDNQAGEWTFNMGYDDNKLLNVDGERVVNTSSWNVTASGKKTLTVGWHRWEVRVQDGSGGWGPCAANNNNTLSYIAPDSTTEKQWNETNLKLAATLGDIAVLDKTGIYRDLVVNEGATLTSSGSAAMGIYGTLKGNGTLTGSFAFKGTNNVWEVAGTGSARDWTTCAKFSAATRTTFVDLASVNVTFDSKPVFAFYPLATVTSDADGTALASDDVADAVVTAKSADGKTDYSSAFTVGVKTIGETTYVGLFNSHPNGCTIFVR